MSPRHPNPNCDTGTTAITSDIFDVVNNPEIDIVVELIGGYTLAKELVLKAIENGKHVVTANKALIAVHGNEIFAKARSEEHTSELQSLMRISYAVFCLKKNTYHYN